MLDETFYIDGIDARSVGILLQSPIEFAKAVPVTTTQTIVGRNGDLINYTGSYKNREAKASCFCLQENVEEAVSAAGRFLMGKRGYRRLETSDDPNHYWMAALSNSPEIEIRGNIIAPFTVTFNCKPQRFVKDGNIPLEAIFAENSTVVKSVFNPHSGIAKPVITVHRNVNDPVRISIGDKTVQVLQGGQESVVIDCDLQTAYAYDPQNPENLNKYIFCEDFPVFEPGENTVVVESESAVNVIIEPRWWDL